jgi:hypothetical protein
MIRKPIILMKLHAFLRRQIMDDFQAAGVTPPRLRIVISGEPSMDSEMILRKESGTIVAVVAKTLSGWQKAFLSRRMAAHIHWFSQTSPEVREISTDLSDGDSPGLGVYRYSTSPNVGIAITDTYFFTRRGYAFDHAFAKDNAVDWNERSDRIVWRGSPNGHGLLSVDPVNLDRPGVRQRLRMAHVCKSTDIDFRFVTGGSQAFTTRLSEAGMIGDGIPPSDWANMKFGIDIDGTTNAWDNFMQRLIFGCCIFKVESQFSFYQWYYHRLTPWEHFIPVKADLSDLREAVDWARSHPDRAREIAAAGQALARSMTTETETRAAVEIIESHEASK